MIKKIIIRSFLDLIKSLDLDLSLIDNRLTIQLKYKEQLIFRQYIKIKEQT